MLNRKHTVQVQRQMQMARDEWEYHFYRGLVVSVLALIFVIGIYLVFILDPALPVLLSACEPGGLLTAFSRSYFFSLNFLVSSAFFLVYIFWLIRIQNAGILEAIASSVIPAIIAYGVSLMVWRGSLATIQIEDFPENCGVQEEGPAFFLHAYRPPERPESRQELQECPFITPRRR